MLDPLRLILGLIIAASVLGLVIVLDTSAAVWFLYALCFLVGCFARFLIDE